ncbi:hypothetical protein RHGRI_008296 [Rhododendron griersonianum]|uniref:Uncharacterized protein n=1 Tax=Rhododendron griersonianum TaxID=479676 RepID=A0AAV6L1T8_9ERIC|nr:hypothetical protein RHGRI_008296 [Rhododendron griersonianum]
MEMKRKHTTTLILRPADRISSGNISLGIKNVSRAHDKANPKAKLIECLKYIYEEKNIALGGFNLNNIVVVHGTPKLFNVNAQIKDDPNIAADFRSFAEIIQFLYEGMMIPGELRALEAELEGRKFNQFTLEARMQYLFPMHLVELVSRLYRRGFSTTFFTL